MKRRITKTVVLLLMVVAVVPFISDIGTGHAAESLAWPVPGHTSLSQGFHDGCAIDISDGSIGGATVVAAFGGTVTNRFDCGTQHYGSMHTCQGFGTGLVIKGDDGRFYQYAHMQAGSIPSSITVGTRVNKGQTIGRVGTTGNSSGNHLHFGISYGSYYSQNGVDPSKENYSNDNTGPSYNDFHICEVKTDQFTVMAHVTDPSGVKNVSYAVWTTNNGQDDLVWYDGVDPEGNSYYWRWIPFSDHKNEKGQYIVDMYAYDNAGNCTTARVGYDFTPDNTAPTVSNIKVVSKDSDGYTISCKVTDSGSGVNRVQFPTWTPHNGQDDLAANWQTNKAVKGTKSGDTYTFRVNRSDHNNEYGDYVTDVYAWDNAGNCSGQAGRIGVKLEAVHEHTLVRTPAKAATTSAEGNIEYWTCSDCGKCFSDSAGKNEITKADTIIPKIEESPGGNDQPSVDPDDSDELPVVTIVKPKAAKKALTVKWKKLSTSDQSKVSGIQVQYSTSKTFKKGVKSVRTNKSKSSKKIKRLKTKKRYYVRIRTYQDTDKATYYSDWSAIKTIKTK